MTGLIIIVLYFLGMLAIGIVSRRKARGADDFFVAGRRSSSPFIIGSLLATIIGGSATIGMAGLGFKQGLTGAWWLLVGSIGLVFLGLFLAKKVRSLALYTLPELVEKQYERRMALATSILIVVAWIGIIAAQVIAAGQILGILGMGSPTMWMVIFTAIFVTYTILGGQHAIIRTDALQGVGRTAEFPATRTVCLSTEHSVWRYQASHASSAGRFNLRSRAGYVFPNILRQG
jgi:SSS family solute:Na+ symporter